LVLQKQEEQTMTEQALLILLSALDRAITAIFSAIKAIQTESAEVQAKKDALIGRMKAFEDFGPPEDAGEME